LSFDRALGATDLLFDFRAALAFVIFLVFDFALFDFALFDLPARFDADLDFPRLTGFFMIPPASAAKRHIGSSFASLAREALGAGNNQALLPITNRQRNLDIAAERFAAANRRCISAPSGRTRHRTIRRARSRSEIDLHAGEGEHQIPRRRRIVLPCRQTTRSK
jgi:hypothetical protein